MKQEQLKLVLFKKEHTSEIAKGIGFDLRKTHCCICGVRTNKENVGHFAHYKGKKVTICKDTTCLLVVLIEEKPEVLGLWKKKKSRRQKRKEAVKHQ